MLSGEIFRLNDPAKILMALQNSGHDYSNSLRYLFTKTT